MTSVYKYNVTQDPSRQASPVHSHIKSPVRGGACNDGGQVGGGLDVMGPLEDEGAGPAGHHPPVLEARCDGVQQGLPHNLTTEYNTKLSWSVLQKIKAHVLCKF